MVLWVVMACGGEADETATMEPGGDTESADDGGADGSNSNGANDNNNGSRENDNSNNSNDSSNENSNDNTSDSNVNDNGGDNSNTNGNSNDNDNDTEPLKAVGAQCDNGSECASGDCESGTCLGALENCNVEDVERPPGGASWADSYSVDGRCYCDTTFDHNIGPVIVDTPDGPMTVREVCEALGPGPGSDGHPVFNDVQCGHGPPNDAGDEDWCPGRVDRGEAGCCTAGARWVFD
ncbi:MAG: hypothetical protein AAFX94_02000 [Myxococcota bacterium]